MPRRDDLQKLNPAVDPRLAGLHTLLGRRAFLGGSATAASLAAMSSLLGRDAVAAPCRRNENLGPSRAELGLMNAAR